MNDTTLHDLKAAEASLADSERPFVFHDWHSCGIGHVHAGIHGKMARRHEDVTEDYSERMECALQAIADANDIQCSFVERYPRRPQRVWALQVDVSNAIYTAGYDDATRRAAARRMVRKAVKHGQSERIRSIVRKAREVVGA